MKKALKISALITVSYKHGASAVPCEEIVFDELLLISYKNCYSLQGFLCSRRSGLKNLTTVKSSTVQYPLSAS